MDNEEIVLMVNDCKKRAANLSEWEFEFIDSLSYIVKKDSPFRLSHKQAERLAHLWERVTA